MRILSFLILLLTVQSCASKKDNKKQLLPEGIKSATEEIYVVVDNQKKLLQRKKMVFTKNGRIKYSKTVDSLDNLLQETKKNCGLYSNRIQIENLITAKHVGKLNNGNASAAILKNNTSKTKSCTTIIKKELLIK